MATYTPENSANAIRTNGPRNPVKTLDGAITFTRGAGREWVGSHGETYQNFGALLGEWHNYIVDVEDPYEEAVKYFADRVVSTSLLISTVAKGHAVEIIKRAVPNKPKSYISQGGTGFIH